MYVWMSLCMYERHRDFVSSNQRYDVLFMLSIICKCGFKCQFFLFFDIAEHSVNQLADNEV
jgi:hypothetical protein